MAISRDFGILPTLMLSDLIFIDFVSLIFVADNVRYYLALLLHMLVTSLAL